MLNEKHLFYSATVWRHMLSVVHVSLAFNGTSFMVPVSQVSEKGSLTAEEFAKLLGLSVLLAKERYCLMYMLHMLLHFVLTASSSCLFILTLNVFLSYRLLLAEKVGHLCRDDSVEGLRFYPNLFWCSSLTIKNSLIFLLDLFSADHTAPYTTLHTKPNCSLCKVDLWKQCYWWMLVLILILLYLVLCIWTRVWDL